jgi:SAM-dependent methyltransferase
VLHPVPAFSDISLSILAWLRNRQFSKLLPVLIQLLDPKKDDIVLDVGAGTGVITNEIAKLSDDVFALEPDPKRVIYVKKKYPQVKAFDGTAEAIQFTEFYFTKICAVSSYHHFKDKQAALYEMYRVLKHGGLLVILESEPEAGHSRFDSRVSGAKFSTPEELIEKLQEAGFEIKELRKVPGRNYFVTSSKS